MRPEKLFNTQSLDRVDQGGASGRQQTGKQRDRREQHGGSAEQRRIVR
jgi:hypothetical protein